MPNGCKQQQVNFSSIVSNYLNILLLQLVWFKFVDINHLININLALIHSNDTYECSSMDNSNSEYKLSYYFEDIGLNAYYLYFCIANPFWISAKSYNLPKIVDLKIRGEYFFFVNQKLMAHYHLERLSNRMSELEQLNWNTDFPGFYSNLKFPNGVPLPQRNDSFILPISKVSILQVS